MAKTDIEPYYQKLANDLVNLLHDKDFLHPELSRKSAEWLEEYIGYLFETHVRSAVKANELLRSIKKSDS